MKRVFLLVALLALSQRTRGAQPRMICYYDTTAATRSGEAKFTAVDMENALQFCTHVIYGYADITPNTFAVTPLNNEQGQQFAQMHSFKQKHPQIKFLLSLGGDRDTKDLRKYLDLLDAGLPRQQTFLLTTLRMLQKYKFDGFDLAYQLPRNKRQQSHSSLGRTLKKAFTSDSVVDPKAKERKQHFTDLVTLLRTSFKANGYMLTLTVLPNVNTELYFDVPAIINKLDFVTLATFDFTTPDRNPEEADYSAPMYPPPAKDNRNPKANIDTQVNQWLAQQVPKSKLIIGIATWGRAWKMTKESNYANGPVITNTKGPAPAGLYTKTPGLLSWPELCLKFRSPSAQNDNSAVLHRVVDDTKKYGNYAYSTFDKVGNNGIWISYEEPQTAALKAASVRKQNLGGVALFDVGMDDLRGLCSGDKFPILRAIKYELI